MAGIKFFGMGNFLGGMSEGFTQMKKLEMERDRLMLESQALQVRRDAMTLDATQFAANQKLAREGMTQQASISQSNQALAKQELDQRKALSDADRSFQYGLHMDAERARGQERLDRKQPTMQDSLLRSYLETDLFPKMDPAEAERIRAMLPAMMTRPGAVVPQAGDPAFAGLNPFASFYKGGIMGTLGQ